MEWSWQLLGERWPQGSNPNDQTPGHQLAQTSWGLSPMAIPASWHLIQVVLRLKPWYPILNHQSSGRNLTGVLSSRAVLTNLLSDDWVDILWSLELTDDQLIRTALGSKSGNNSNLQLAGKDCSGGSGPRRCVLGPCQMLGNRGNPGTQTPEPSASANYLLAGTAVGLESLASPCQLMGLNNPIGSQTQLIVGHPLCQCRGSPGSLSCSVLLQFSQYQAPPALETSHDWVLIPKSHNSTSWLTHAAWQGAWLLGIRDQIPSCF